MESIGGFLVATLPVLGKIRYNSQILASVPSSPSSHLWYFCVAFPLIFSALERRFA